MGLFDIKVSEVLPLFAQISTIVSLLSMFSMFLISNTKKVTKMTITLENVEKTVAGLDDKLEDFVRTSVYNVEIRAIKDRLVSFEDELKEFRRRV